MKQIIQELLTLEVNKNYLIIVRKDEINNDFLDNLKQIQKSVGCRFWILPCNDMNNIRVEKEKYIEVTEDTDGETSPKSDRQE